MNQILFLYFGNDAFSCTALLARFCFTVIGSFCGIVMGKHLSSLCYVKALKDDSKFSGKKAIKNILHCRVQKKPACVKLCNNCTRKKGP